VYPTTAVESLENWLTWKPEKGKGQCNCRETFSCSHTYQLENELS